MRIREIAWLARLSSFASTVCCSSIDCCSATNLPDSNERRGYYNWLVRVECAAPTTHKFVIDRLPLPRIWVESTQLCRFELTSHI